MRKSTDAVRSVCQPKNKVSDGDYDFSLSKSDSEFE